MNYTLTSIAALALAAGLAACDQQAGDTAVPDQAPASANTADSGMGGMAMGTDAKPVMATSTGKVTAVDAAAGKITIAHEPIPEANWPAMTMAFEASPDMLKGVATGDQIGFDVEIRGDSAEVKSIGGK